MGSIEETLLISLGRLVTIVQSITWVAAGICWPSFSPWPQLLDAKVKVKSRVWRLLPLMLKEAASPSWGQGGLNKQKPLAEEDVTFSHIQKMQRLKGETPSRLGCCPLCAERWGCAPTERREATITALEKLGGEIALVFWRLVFFKLHLQMCLKIKTNYKHVLQVPWAGCHCLKGRVPRALRLPALPADPETEPSKGGWHGNILPVLRESILISPFPV